MIKIFIKNNCGKSRLFQLEPIDILDRFAVDVRHGERGIRDGKFEEQRDACNIHGLAKFPQKGRFRRKYVVGLVVLVSSTSSSLSLPFSSSSFTRPSAVGVALFVRVLLLLSLRRRRPRRLPRLNASSSPPSTAAARRRAGSHRAARTCDIPRYNI